DWLIANEAGREAAPQSRSTVELSHQGRAAPGDCLESSADDGRGGTCFITRTTPNTALPVGPARGAGTSSAADAATQVYSNPPARRCGCPVVGRHLGVEGEFGACYSRGLWTSFQHTPILSFDASTTCW